MGTTKQSTDENDYAVAMALNECVIDIFWIISNYQLLGPLEEFDPIELNRAYVLLVDELEKLYDRSPKLAEIKPDPLWKQFDMLKGSFYEIQKYIEDRDDLDMGRSHRDRVEKLCIIAGKETPDFSLEQKKLVDLAKAIKAKYFNLVLEDLQKRGVPIQGEGYEADDEDDRTWYLKEYTLTYKYGAIIINDVLKLKKAHDGSALDELMLKALDNPNELFVFKPKKETKRTVSTILSNAGFTPTLRKLFFPEAGKSRGVLFRPSISNETAMAERIDTTDLDQRLKDAGAEVVSTEPDEDELEFVEKI